MIPVNVFDTLNLIIISKPFVNILTNFLYLHGVHEMVCNQFRRNTNTNIQNKHIRLTPQEQHNIIFIRISKSDTICC